jgi:hypothetical protein
MECVQFITFGFACTPLYFVWEKVIGMHDTRSICLRALARLPVVIPIWFLAIIFPFFGPINSAVGALLVSFTVYIIPSLAHMLTYRKASARQVKKKKSLLSASPLARAALLALALFPFGQAVCFRYLFWWASCNYLDQLSGHSGLMGIPSHIPQLQCPLKREKERGCCKCTKAFKFWIWKYYEKN